MNRILPSCLWLPRLPRALGLLLLVLTLQACQDDSITGPDTSGMEILVLAGDQQSAGPGAPLPGVFRVRVQTISNGTGKEGITVRWEILEGAGGELDHTTSVTDSAGVAQARLTLGPGLGVYRVRASVPGMTAPPAEFRAQAILDPELTLVPGGPAIAGDTITLEGRNFSSLPGENVVTFSGVRGRVLEASREALRVQVPACLPEREVRVVVRIGSLASEARTMAVRAGESFLSLAVGEDRILDASEALACFRLPSESEARYLLVGHSTGTVGGAEYPFQLLGLTSDGVHPTPGAPEPLSAGGRGFVAPSGVPGPVPESHWEWEVGFRAMEREWLSRGAAVVGEPEGPPGAMPVSTPPAVGDLREFNVLNKDNEFDEITARVHTITDNALVYVDLETPSEGFSDEDLAFFANRFQDPIYPTVTRIFGSESDLDDNGRVIILFTPGVNRLTPEDSDGYVGGFFFGLDLEANRPGSNKGEIFYAVVPDPSGIHGPPLSRITLLNSLPAILAHEFEHMVHYNQRILVSGASSQEALWLSEGLAQMAEDLVGEAFLERGNPITATDFQLGNWGRARRFLLNPSQVSVLATLPPGTLAERGAAWLLLKHLFGRHGGVDFIHSLTASTLTGDENVTHATGRGWPDIVSDWAGSLYLDGLSVPVRIGLRVLGVNLREVMARFSGTYPLTPLVSGASSFSVSGSLWSSAPYYHILTTPETGGLAVNFSGSQGQAPNPAAGFQILVVRLR